MLITLPRILGLLWIVQGSSGRSVWMQLADVSLFPRAFLLMHGGGEMRGSMLQSC